MKYCGIPRALIFYPRVVENVESVTARHVLVKFHEIAGLGEAMFDVEFLEASVTSH